ncbi:hypothetical protein [Blastococcus saxobsidens]|uniref:Uncharacterized protein n=1 Tax=Blastococcus saxobsidens (strain DD2) TaxID=1146883 RepID=H6RIL9_BLASD|nr:hypothetical protein [Blastococcus saxobsidens]CCG02213.1 conserved protein of unknown function [Blastococcus saxobsidens DD2]
MLALIPAPLQTAGERAFFGELARWDTGGSVRAAVVASLPLVDGPLGRRQSDAVLLVPEGIAVIRVAEVVRQSGVVRATPEGSWTIAADDGPSQVLQLAGGGSTPLDGLMRAGMDTAVKLRRAGLEPGRIARLTVLVGEVTGLDPADGDLGEGDHVATLDPRSLLLAIARASRHAGVDNPRLWTTADVRAALEALEYPGRGPSVEELNGEAFPYSPYVLRRPQLLTPAAMNAAPKATPPAPQAAEPSPTPAPNPGDPLSATGVARAVAASVASAHAAAVAAAAPAAPAPGRTGQRDTVEVDGEPAPPAGDAGIGGLFGRERESAGATDGPVPPPSPRTAVLPATPGAEEPRVRPPLSPAWGATASGNRAEGGPSDGAARTRWVIAAVVLALVVLGATAAGVLLGGGDEGATPGTTAPVTESAPSGPAPGEVRTVDGTAYTLQAVQVDDTCAGHAYGQVAEFLAATDCTGLARALYSASVEGAPVVVSVSRVAMADTAIARELRELTDTDGSGNVSDLLREGVTYAGGPAKLSSAQYASAVSGPTVTVVETAWANPATTGSVAALDKAASDGLALPVPPPPGG